MLLSNRYTGVTRWFSLAGAACASMLGACMTKDDYEFEPSARIRRELDYCAVHSACEGQHLTECLHEIRAGGEVFGAWPGWYSGRDECVKSASSCAEYQLCLTQHRSGGACDSEGFECARPDQVCDPGVVACVDEKQPKEPCKRHDCAGNELVTCLEGKTQSVDCAAVHPHMTCRMVNGSPQCSVQPGAVECDTDRDLGTCDGATARVCVASRWVDIDCSRAFGAACVYDEASTGVRCATTPDFAGPESPEPQK